MLTLSRNSVPWVGALGRTATSIKALPNAAASTNPSLSASASVNVNANATRCISSRTAAPLAKVSRVLSKKPAQVTSNNRTDLNPTINAFRCFSVSACSSSSSSSAVSSSTSSSVSATATATATAVAPTTANKEKLFDKILIANRGEIACRVIRSAKKLGIKTVAIYSDADVAGLHVREADEAYRVGPPPSAQSYLNIPRILEIIKETGAQAVHPGYGFLSENTNFAAELEKVGVRFIGPNADAVHAMGDKIESITLAQKAKVNTIPGNLETIKDAKQCVEIAREIGYPVMIKASAGGGGKGMRIAYDDKGCDDGFRLASDEARNSFGDDRVFVEKFVEEPHHVEVQVLGDSHGNVIALPERECSIQRRHQKVLEEAPSPFLDPETRAAMQTQAVQLAKAVNYQSAGTVEFLVDKDKNFYFLEMNTRLQVEHPITELITGIDLVEQMIRVAAGHRLPEEWLKSGKGYPFTGWAHEVRVYAESPERGFVPSSGRLLTYMEPTPEEFDGKVRCDSGVTQGSEVSDWYDPMISKLCTYGADRLEALHRMEEALDNYVIVGPGTNISFCRDVLRSKRFQEGKLTTNYIPEEYPDGFSRVELEPTEIARLATISALLHMQREYRARSISPNAGDLPSAEEALICTIDGESYEVELQDERETLEFADDEFPEGDLGSDADEGTVRVRALSPESAVGEHFVKLQEFEWDLGSPLARAVVDNLRTPVKVRGLTPEGFQLTMSGANHLVTVHTKREHKLAGYMLPKVALDTSKWLIAPMPGKLVTVYVKPGQTVFAGETLLDIESMKMVSSVKADRQTVVKAIKASEGDSLISDQVLLEFEDSSKDK